jgi:hypothetical protein
MKKVLFLAGWALAMLLVGCSDQPPAETKKAPEPARPVTGQTALYRMYQVARSWSSDVEVLRMNSMHLTEVPEEHGKAGAWQAAFVSESKNAARTYTYSVVEAEPNIHQGVFPGPTESWSGPSGDTKPFLIAAVKTDTDAAYKTASEHATGAPKNPPIISFLLEKPNKFSDAAWRVIWGESLGTAGVSVYIDASLGTYLETLH